MVIKEYFKIEQDAPAPIEIEIKRRVRFDELDPLAIMWHGNYASFFEEARVALGNKYGIGYMDFAESKTIIPLKKFHVDFFAPLEFNNEYTVRARLHFTHAARLNFEYEIYNASGKLMTTGYTVHMILDKDNNIMVAKPAFFEEFCVKWQKGQIS
ncbi:acyl-CoA thioester hydrolase [Parelusimicrobium proximum]|uniref:acyl-CoA thioesterase n=1 Tax=Parelusimicrobium proximum TaxID=3228953 RepID=UPI003D170A54